MISKGMMIFRDILYTILIVVLLLPSNPIGVNPVLKMLFIVIAVGSRIWQHVNYYKQTGKIY